MNRIFLFAFDALIDEEGGYSNHKDDRGGATKYGISLRFLKLLDKDGDLDGDGHVTQKDIEALDLEAAKEIYFKHFWQHYQCYRYKHAELSARMLSMYVNMRSKAATTILQKALHAVGRRDVTIDGYTGDQTIGAANQVLHDGLADCLMAAIRAEQANFYRRIVEQNQSQEVFLKGWLNRAYRIYTKK